MGRYHRGMATSALLIGMSCEDSARSWVYPAVQVGDQVLVAGRVVVEHTTHLFVLIDRGGIPCMISGTHTSPRDYPELRLVEDPSPALLLVTAAQRHLLTPEVAAALGSRCTDADLASALASDLGVRETVMRALPHLRQGSEGSCCREVPRAADTE